MSEKPQETQAPLEIITVGADVAEWSDKTAITLEKKGDSVQVPFFPQVPEKKEIEVSDEFKKWREQKTMIGWYLEEKALPKDMTAGQAMMVIELGKNIGLNMMEAFQGIAFVNGRPSIWWEIAVSLMTKAGYKIEFIESTATKCKAKVSWPNGSMEDEFTLEEAKKAGWLQKSFSVWHTNPKLMLRYKVISNIRKFLCPWVLGWLLLKEEVEVEIPEDKTKWEVKLDALDLGKFKKTKADDIQDGEVLPTNE